MDKYGWHMIALIHLPHLLREGINSASQEPVVTCQYEGQTSILREQIGELVRAGEGDGVVG